MDSTADVSSPGYFQTTFGVDAVQAAALSAQARMVGRTGGGGITAQAPSVGAPASASAPAVPGQAALSAQAEYDALMADRTSGKITTAQWKATGAARERALAELIANGAGTHPAPATAAPVDDAMATHFAPPAAPGDYRFPVADNVTDEQMAADAQIKSAMHAVAFPRGVAESIADSLRRSTLTLANESPEQTKSRIDGNRARMTEMWAHEGITFDQGMHTIDAQLRQWSTNATLRPIIENAARFLGPLDWDAILQYAKHKGAARR